MLHFTHRISHRTKISVCREQTIPGVFIFALVLPANKTLSSGTVQWTSPTHYPINRVLPLLLCTLAGFKYSVKPRALCEFGDVK